jgi:hypothetical protein
MYRDVSLCHRSASRCFVHCLSRAGSRYFAHCLSRAASRYFALLRAASRYFALLRADSRYFALLRATSRCFALIRAASRYFALIRATSRYFALLRATSRCFALSCYLFISRIYGSTREYANLFTRIEALKCSRKRRALTTLRSPQRLLSSISIDIAELFALIPRVLLRNPPIHKPLPA